MFLKNKEYETLKSIMSLFPTGEDFQKLPEDQKALIEKYDTLMLVLYRRKQEGNKKTAEYIAEKRKTNKNYARGNVVNAGHKINFDDDLVVVMKDNQVVYKGIEDNEPMKDDPWVFVPTTKTGKGHYKYKEYIKYKVD